MHIRHLGILCLQQWPRRLKHNTQVSEQESQYLREVIYIFNVLLFYFPAHQHIMRPGRDGVRTG